jgi:hypothetical protein
VVECCAYLEGVLESAELAELPDDAVELVLLHGTALLRPLAQHHRRAPLRVDELQQPLPQRVPPPRFTAG